MTTPNNFANAEYNRNLCSRYLGNPLIEAIPEMMSEGEFIGAMTRTIEPDTSAPLHQRVAMCEDLHDVIIPTEFYWPVYQIVYSMLLNSYANRNPTVTENIKFSYDRAIQKKKADNEKKRTTGGGTVLISPSGSGKTTMFGRIFQFLPSMINHTCYPYGEFKVKKQQVVIFLEIPSTGSRKTLMKMFFEEIDTQLGTNYLKKFGNLTIADFEPVFRTICSTFYVGLIVIDDIQNLKRAPKGEDEALLTFMSSLSNQIGVGFVKIGTPEAASIINAKFTPLRRSTTAGDYIIDRYSKDDFTWKTLVAGLWQFQWTKNSTASNLIEIKDGDFVIKNQAIYDLIYDLSQGIPYLLTFLLISSQKWAIQTGHEKLDIKALRGGHKASSFIMAAVEAIRNDEDDHFEDLMVSFKSDAEIEKKKIATRLLKIIEKGGMKGKLSSKVKALYQRFSTQYALNTKEKAIAAKFAYLLDQEEMANTQEANLQPVDVRG